MTELIAGVGGTVDYFPTVNGNPFDPVNNGGAMTSLKLYSNATRTTLLTTVVGATKIGTGHYRFAVPAAGAPTAGYVYSTFTWSATGAGPVVTDDNDTIPVWALAGGVDNGIVTVADVQQVANQTFTGSRLTEIETYIDVVTSPIENGDGKFRGVGPVITRTFTDEILPSGEVLLLPRYPVSSVTSLTGYEGTSSTVYTSHTLGQAYPTNGYRLSGRAGMVSRAPVSSWPSSPVVAVYQAGWQGFDVDAFAAIKDAAAKLVLHLFLPNEFGVVNPETGSVSLSSAGRPGYLLPNEVVALLKPYERVPACA